LSGPTPRTTVRRLPDRARYDRASVHAILDEGLVCHVGFVDEGQPFVIPSVYARLEDRLVLHGSAASRMIKVLAGGAPRA
jgi:nitroimidazol reductase NimA-like FMN-containing flavoprotein (pyridoxamine 5'-phosphate oxidase superfamily)